MFQVSKLLCSRFYQQTRLDYIKVIIIIIIIIMSFTAKIGSEKHNGDKIDGRMLADRLLL